MNSDYKNKRVQDPTRISSKQEKQVKKYVKDFFDKAVAKRVQHDRKKAERRAKDYKNDVAVTPLNEEERFRIKEEEEDVKVDLENMNVEDDIESEDGNDSSKEESSQDEGVKDGESPSDLKRKRQNETPPADQSNEDDLTTPKKIKSEIETPPPPPPPPPPPEDTQDDSLEAKVKDDSFGEKASILKQEQIEENLPLRGSDILLQASEMDQIKTLKHRSNGETHSYSQPKLNGSDGIPNPMQLVKPPVNGPFDLEKTSDRTKHVDSRKAAQEVTVADS